MSKLQQLADFSGHTIYVGIDVHLKNWDISIFHNKQYIRSFHQAADASILANTLMRDYPHADIQCAYEAGFSGYWLQRNLCGKGINCIVINPADVPQTDKDKKSKTDRRDSRKIAQSLEAGQSEGIYIPDEESEGDRRLVRYRLQVLSDLTRSKNRLKHLLYQQGIDIPSQFRKNRWSNAFIEWIHALKPNHSTVKYTLDMMISQIEILRKELTVLTKKTQELIKTERYKKTAELLLSVPGIGPITAASLLVEINNINRFPTFVQFNSYIGLCPGQHSSGEYERKGHIINRHHTTLRALFIEAAWVAVKSDPAMMLAFGELKKKMTAKRSIIRIARKLLNRVYHVWMKGELYKKGIVK